MFRKSLIFLVFTIPFVVDSYPEPYGYWPLTEGWGMRDLSGNGFHGRYANVSGEPSFTHCEICSFKYCESNRLSSYNAGFKGEDDYVVIDHPELNFNYTSWTFACFFNSRGTMGPILEYPINPLGQVAHFWANYPYPDYFYLNPVSSDGLVSSFPCQLQDWQFVSISYDLSIKRYSFFCNDTVVGEFDANSPTFSPILNLAKR